MALTVRSGRLYSYVQDLEALEALLPLKVNELPPIPTFPAGETVIEQLIMANEDVWNKLLDNKFCADGYTTAGETFNSIFQGFAKQDYLYLIEYVRFVAYRALQQPTSHTEAGLKTVVEYLGKKVLDVEDFFNTCVNGMGITQQDLLTERVSAQVLGYTVWEQLNGMTDDPYSNYVRMIPCIYGWNQIAQKLEQGGSGVTDTYFYKYWFEGSIDDGSAKKLNKYLEDNLDAYNCKANWARWNIAFRQACLFEIAFFDAALNEKLITII